MNNKTVDDPVCNNSACNDPASNDDESLMTVRDFRRNLRLLERQIESALSSQTGCCGVTVAQCHLILELDQSGPAGIGDFARALDLDASTLSRTVDGLVRAGLVSRETDPDNRRRQVVALTPAGRDSAGSIHGLCDRYYTGILGSIPATCRTSVTAGIAMLAEALRRQPFDGCGCESGTGTGTGMGTETETDSRCRKDDREGEATR